MAAKKAKAKKARFGERHLVQALVDKDLLDWIEKMAAERDLRTGSYVRALLRWCKDTELGGMGQRQAAVFPLDGRGKPIKQRTVRG